MGKVPLTARSRGVDFFVCLPEAPPQVSNSEVTDMADTPAQHTPEAGETLPRATGRAPMGMTFVTGLAGDLMAEFFGTMVLIAFGDGVVAMAVAALNQSGRGNAIFLAAGDWLLITWGWAVAVTFG